MPHTLLHTNHRIAALGLVAATLLVALSFAIIATGQAAWWRMLGCVLVTVAAYFAYCGWRFRTVPRLALTDRELLVHVRLARRPVRVPLDVVEVFFLGQGAVSGEEPGHPREYQGAVAANVIVRLAESNVGWHTRKVNQRLAVWADGYITLRGLWCENIDQDLLKSMNGALMAAKRKIRKGDSP